MRFLLVDRILQLEPSGYTLGIKHVTQDDVFVQSEDASSLVFVPSFIGEALGQLAAWNAMQTMDFSHRPVAGVVGKASLYQPVKVGDTLFLESFLETLDEEKIQYHSVAKVREEIVFTLDGALGPLLPMQDFIEEKVVRNQFEHIYRPCEILPQAPVANILSSPTAYHGFTFDSILSITPGLHLIAEKYISYSAPYFPDHFPLRPVLPLTILLECKRHLVSFFLSSMQEAPCYRIIAFQKIKMSQFVLPGDTVRTEITIKEQSSNLLILQLKSEVQTKRVCIVEIVIEMKEPWCMQ